MRSSDTVDRSFPKDSSGTGRKGQPRPPKESPPLPSPRLSRDWCRHATGAAADHPISVCDPLSMANADREGEASAVNTIAIIVGHVSDDPVARSSRRSATEIPPARHRPDLGKLRVSRSSLRRNASRGATSPTRAISETSPTVRLSLRINRVHSTGARLLPSRLCERASTSLAAPQERRPPAEPPVRPNLSPKNETHTRPSPLRNLARTASAEISPAPSRGDRSPGMIGLSQLTTVGQPRAGRELNPSSPSHLHPSAVGA